jgi:hypothetical protein
LKASKEILLLLVALMVFATSCGKSTPISFEKVANDISLSYSGESALIYIFSSNQSYPKESIKWVMDNDLNKILEVDYSEYFVLAAFNGFRTNIYPPGFNIKRVEKHNNNTVLVIAHFNEYEKGQVILPSYSSYYEVVKIRRDQITQSGTITFKLLDEKGKERARTTAELNSDG